MLSSMKYTYNHHWWIPSLVLNELWVFSAHISKYHRSFKYLKYEVLLIYFKLFSVANPFDIPINLLWCAIYTSSPEQNWRVMLVSEKWGFRYSRTKKSCIWCADSIVRYTLCQSLAIELLKSNYRFVSLLLRFEGVCARVSVMSLFLRGFMHWWQFIESSMIKLLLITAILSYFTIELFRILFWVIQW